MKLIKLGIGFALIGIICSGCVRNSGNFCEIARPIYGIDNIQVHEHNAIYWEMCL